MAEEKTDGQLNLSVVNWEGEEKARLQVFQSDIVLVGMRQIEEQIGVPPRNQRLVLGEQQLEEDMMWLEYGAVNWSAIQLTTIVEVSADEYINHTSILHSQNTSIIHQEYQPYNNSHIYQPYINHISTMHHEYPNLLAPLELSPMHKRSDSGSDSFSYNPYINPYLSTKSHYVVVRNRPTCFHPWSWIQYTKAKGSQPTKPTVFSSLGFVVPTARLCWACGGWR